MDIHVLAASFGSEHVSIGSNDQTDPSAASSERTAVAVNGTARGRTLSMEFRNLASRSPLDSSTPIAKRSECDSAAQRPGRIASLGRVLENAAAAASVTPMTPAMKETTSQTSGRAQELQAIPCIDVRLATPYLASRRQRCHPRRYHRRSAFRLLLKPREPSAASPTPTNTLTCASPPDSPTSFRSRVDRRVRFREIPRGAGGVS